jgi:hypothetical protein
MVLMSMKDTAFLRPGGALLMTGCLVAALTAGANPYSVIGDRNIFGLTDPPVAAPPPVEEEPKILPGVRITGITTLMGIERALVKLSIPADPKTKTPASEESYILVAGGPAQGGVEVLEIQDDPDPAEVKIKVRQGGEESWLSLEKDKVAAARAPAPAPTAKTVAAANASPAQKLAMQRAAATRARAGGVTRPTGTSQPGGMPSSLATGGLPNRNVRTAQGGVPGTPGYGTGVSATQRPNRSRVSRDYGLTPEEQVILIEANRETTILETTLGAMPPLPPTPLTPPDLDPTTPPQADPINDAFQNFPAQ